MPTLAMIGESQKVILLVHIPSVKLNNVCWQSIDQGAPPVDLNSTHMSFKVILSCSLRFTTSNALSNVMLETRRDTSYDTVR